MMPSHGLGMPLDTTPFLILSSPFLAIHAPLLLGQAGVGQGQPCSAQLPLAWEPGQVGPGQQLSMKSVEPLATSCLLLSHASLLSFSAAPAVWES